MLIESLETRRLMSASLGVNPGSPESVNSGNLVAIDSSAVTHNGSVVSQQAQAGTRADTVQALLKASGRGSEA